MNYENNTNQNPNNLNVVPNMTPNMNTNVVPNTNPTSVVTPVNPVAQVTPVSQPQVATQAPLGNNIAEPKPATQPFNQLNNVQNPQVMNNQTSTAIPNNNVQNNRVINNSNNAVQDKFKIIINGLFNFNNIKKLFKYDWSSMIEDTLPKDTKESIDKESYDNIFYGGILKVVADLLAIVFSVCMVYVIDTLEPARIAGLRTLGLKNDVGISAFVPLVITLVIFTYNSAIGYQKQKTIFHFSFIWLICISTVFSLIKLISYIAALFISPLYALLGFISLFLTLLGNIHVLVGCIDFCKRVTHNYIEAHTVAPVQGPITTTRISVDDVSDHNSRTCPYCANQNPKDATVCSTCGKTIQ